MADILSTAFPTLHRIVDAARNELTRRLGYEPVLTDRLKILITAAAGVIILSCLIGMHQLVSSLERGYERAQIDRMRLIAQIESGGWEQRKQQSQVLKSLLEERLWSAQTPGLADASFERWLRDRLGPYQLDPLQPIQVRRVPVVRQSLSNEPESSLSSLQRMTAKVIAPFSPDGLPRFLAELAEADKTILVDRISVRAGRNARIDMDISTFYRAPGGAQ